MLQIKTLTALIAIAISSQAYAGPTGGVFRAGSSGTVTAPSGTSTEVIVNTGSITNYTDGSKRHTAVMDWSSFQVAGTESVKFINNISAGQNLHLLNVDNGGVMSKISGAITSVSGSGAPAGAKTTVYVINPNGVSIGASAAINTTGSFYAAPGTVNSSDPGRVIVNLNQAPVTVAPGASVTAGKGEQAVRFGAAGSATLPAGFHDLNSNINVVIELNASTSAGSVFTVSNSASTGQNFRLPENSTLEVSNSVLNKFAVDFVSATDSRTLATGTASITNSTLNGFSASAKSGTSKLTFGDIVNKGQIYLPGWLGKTEVSGVIINNVSGNIRFRFDGLDYPSPVRITGGQTVFEPADTRSIDSSFINPTSFNTGAQKAVLKITNGNVYACLKGITDFKNVEITAKEISLGELGGTTKTAYSNLKFNSQNTQIRSGLDLVIGDGVTPVEINAVGSVFIASGNGNVTIASNTALNAQKLADLQEISVNGKTSISYVAGSAQLSENKNNFSSSAVIDDAGVDARNPLIKSAAPMTTKVNSFSDVKSKANPARNASGIYISADVVTVAGTLKIGTPPPVVVPPYVAPTMPKPEPIVIPQIVQPPSQALVIRVSNTIDFPTLEGQVFSIPSGDLSKAGSVNISQGYIEKK